MVSTKFDPRDYAAHRADEFKRETAFANEIDDTLEGDAYSGGMGADGVRRALFLLIVSTLTSKGCSVDGLIDDVRAAAVSPNQSGESS